MTDATEFDESVARPGTSGDGLVLMIDGFEGPIDLLLSLAREQKVDLHKISILSLAEQYLAYIAAAKRLRLEIAADYLVMAAWLAYLKSRLLLPAEEQSEDGPTAEEMAELLAFQLRRLEAMREAGAKILSLPQLGRDTFVRGEPEGLANIATPVFEVTLFDLLKAYGEHKRRAKEAVLHIEPTGYYSMDEALQRLGRMVGHLPDWATLVSFLPDELRDPVAVRSAVASMFAAALEMTRSGRVQLRQEQMFGPIFLKSSATVPTGPVLVQSPPTSPQAGM